jgi:hypothetical protein
LLNKQWQFDDHKLLDPCWRFGIILLLNAHWQIGDTLLLNIHWQFWQPLIAKTEMIDLVAFDGLEGVNYVFSHVSLIIVATFLFSIFAISLLTNLFAPFLAAWESNFSSRFLYLWHFEVVRLTCAPIFLAQNAWVS